MLQSVGIGGIGGCRDGLAACRLDGRYDAVDSGLIAPRRLRSAPRAQQASRGGCADAARSAGDQRDMSPEAPGLFGSGYRGSDRRIWGGWCEEGVDHRGQPFCAGEQADMGGSGEHRELGWW